MAMLNFYQDTHEDDVARAKAQPIDAKRIAAVVAELRSAIEDDGAYKSVVERLATDKSFAASEVVLIAHAFLGGVKQKNRQAAVSAIARRRLEIAHARAKEASAAKTRLW